MKTNKADDELWNLILKYIPFKDRDECVNTRAYYYKEIDFYLSKKKLTRFNRDEYRVLVDISFFVKRVVTPLEDVVSMWNKMPLRINKMQSGSTQILETDIADITEITKEFERIIYAFNIQKGLKIGRKYLKFEDISELFRFEQFFDGSEE